MEKRLGALLAILAHDSQAHAQVAPRRGAPPQIRISFIPTVEDVRRAAASPVSEARMEARPAPAESKEQFEDGGMEAIKDTARDNGIEALTHIGAPPMSFGDLFKIGLEKAIEQGTGKALNLSPAKLFIDIISSPAHDGGSQSADEPRNPDYSGPTSSSVSSSSDGGDETGSNDTEDEVRTPANDVGQRDDHSDETRQDRSDEGGGDSPDD